MPHVEDERKMNVDLFLQSLKRHEGRLFGRDDEVQELRKILRESVETKKPKAAFVHGYAGSGKSQLIQYALQNHAIKVMAPRTSGSAAGSGAGGSSVNSRRDWFARSHGRRGNGISQRSKNLLSSKNILNTKGSSLGLGLGGSQMTNSTFNSTRDSTLFDSRISTGSYDPAGSSNMLPSTLDLVTSSADMATSSLGFGSTRMPQQDDTATSTSLGGPAGMPMIGGLIEVTMIQEENSDDCTSDDDSRSRCKSPMPDNKTSAGATSATTTSAPDEVPSLMPMQDGSNSDHLMDCGAPETIQEEEEEEEEEERKEEEQADDIPSFPALRRQDTKERRRNAVAEAVPAGGGAASSARTCRSSITSTTTTCTSSSSSSYSSISWKPLYVSGKFDQQRTSTPYSALADACSMLCRALDPACANVGAAAASEEEDGPAYGMKNYNRRLVDTTKKPSPTAARQRQKSSLVDWQTVQSIVSTMERNLRRDYSVLLPLIPELEILLPTLASEHQKQQEQQEEQKQKQRSQKSLQPQRSLQLDQVFEEQEDDDDEEDQFNLSNGVRGGGKSWHDLSRLKDSIKTFLSSVSKHTPVVLFIDDLQWADAPSLEIISSLLPDTRVNGHTSMLMVVGAYRDNEMANGSHPQAKAVQELETKQCSTKIHVIDLGLGPLNTFVASLLKYEDTPQITMPLTKSIHERTRGNVFFVIQFLQMLVTTEILRYSFLSMKWEWDKEKLLEQTQATENVTDLVITRMRRLPPQTALALIIASQLGNRFDGALVKAVLDKWKDHGVENIRTSFKKVLDESWNVSSLNLNVDMSESSVGSIPEDLSFLDVPIAEGFIVPMDTFNNLATGGTGSWFRFLHDRIQQAAAGLIEDECELKQLRLRLGTLLLDVQKKTENKRNWAVLTAVDLLNTTFDIVDENRRLDLAEANYQAAQIAAMQSAFVAAAWYLSQSRYLLQGYPNIWEDNYRLAIRVYSMSAEMEYCCGNTSQCLELFEEVKHHHKQPKDSWLASYIAMKCLGSEAKYDECIEVAYGVLREAGFHMPKHSFDIRHERTQYDDVFSIYGKTMEALSGKTDSEILLLPEEEVDETSSLVWQILASTVLFVWHSRRSLDFTYLCCSAFLRTLERGLGEYSGKAFALLGFCSLANQDYAVAHRMQKLWTHPEIVQRYAGTHAEASTLATAYVATGHAFVPVTKVADAFLKGYNSGMQFGSIEWAMSSAASFLLSHFIGGLPLKMYVKRSHFFIKEMKKYRNKIHKPMCKMYLQLAVNLMGERGGKNVEALHLLQGDNLDEYDMPRIIGGTHLLPGFPVHIAWFVQLMLSYYFEDYDTAAEMAVKHEDSGIQDWPMIWSVPQPYFRGLAYVEKVRLLKQKKPPMGIFSCGFSSVREEIKEYTHRAKKQLHILKENASNGMINMVHQYKILEAEIASITATRSNYQDVLDTYLEAIRSATRSGFRQDAALASEKAGLFVMSHSTKKDKIDPSNASYHIHKSIEMYEKWGATVKADNMKAMYSELGLYDPKRKNRRAHTESIITRASSDKIYHSDNTMNQQQITITSSIISMSTNRTGDSSASTRTDGSFGTSSKMTLGSTTNFSSRPLGPSGPSYGQRMGLSSRLLRGKSSSKMNLGSQETTSSKITTAGLSRSTNSTPSSQFALDSSSRLSSLRFSTDTLPDTAEEVF